MRINSILPLVSFKGKVHVYSDFDETYCPERHSDMHNPVQNPFMVQYCNKMSDLFKSAKDDMDFHVTTGRTFGEYEAVSWLLKFRDYRLPLPDSLITKNGSDEFIKNGSDEDFYDRGIFPYSYDNTSKEKEETIKNLTNWDGEKIKEYIKHAAKKVYLKFVEGETENSVKDYGNKSLYSNGKLNSNEWKKLPQEDGEIIHHENPIADFVIGARNDGKLKINLIFPPDYDYCPFRTWVYDEYINKIKKHLDNRNVKYTEQWSEPNHRNHYRKSVSITPAIEGKELTKLFDVKQAVEKAKKSKDIVIVAGDGSNDEDILNPLNYISEAEWKIFEKDTKCPEFFKGDMHKKLRDLKYIYKGVESEYITDLREELANKGFLKKIEQMPIVGIVINKENSPLQKIVDTFSSTGKIIKIEKGELDKGIKQAVKNYAQLNCDFKNDMPENLVRLIFNEN